MAEALAAMGIACNIFQVISFAHEVYDVFKEIRETGSSDAEFLNQVTTIANLSESLKSRISHVWPVTKEESDLVALAEKCLVLSSKLQADLRSDSGIRKSLKAWWRRSSNKKRRDELFALEQAMQTQMMATGWIRNQGVQAEQQDAFEHLDRQLKDFISQVSRGHTKMEDLLRAEAITSRDHTTIEADRVQNHITAQFSSTTARLDHEVDKQERIERQQKLLSSLAFPEMNARKNTSSIDAFPGTFRWIFDANKVHAWDSLPSFLTSQEQNLYWISGKPGSGKSTLMKYLIGQEKTRELLEQWSSNPLIISYFFWLRGSPMQRSTKGLLASLLYQILDSSLDMVIFPADSFLWRKKYIDDWSLQEMEATLLQFSQSLNRPICIFLDGLDEHDPEENQLDLVALIDRLKQQDHFKICLASRPERAFQEKYRTFPTMRLQDLTRSDMEHYVSQELEHYMSTSHLRNDEEKCEDLIKMIVKKAQGVFLWIHLVLRSLHQGIKLRNDNWDVLTERVVMMPNDLKELYRDMLARLGTEMELYRRDAALYFSYVLEGPTNLVDLSFTQSPFPDDVINKVTPMPSLEFLNLRCDMHQQRIEDYSAGLLEVDKIVGPPTVKEYWKHLQWVRFQKDTIGKPAEDAEKIVTQLCRFGARQNQTIHFIHRTAADFLLETPEGQNILACSPVSPSQIWVNKQKASIVSFLAGSGMPFYALFESIQSCEHDLEQSQVPQLMQRVEKIFDSLLWDLETLRGRTLQPTVESLYSMAKSTTIVFLVSAMAYTFLQPWEEYTKTVATKGYCLSNDFKGFILFQVLVQWEQASPRSDCNGHLDLLLRLLMEGADANARKGCCSDTFYPRPGFGQNLCAFELFLLHLIRSFYWFDDPMDGSQSLIAQQHVAIITNILNQMLSQGPDLKKKIEYNVELDDLDDNFESDNECLDDAPTFSVRRAVWSITSGSLLQEVRKRLFEDGVEGLQVQPQNGTDAGTALLLCIGTLDGKYIVPDVLGQPPMFDLAFCIPQQIECPEYPEDVLRIYPKEVLAMIENIADHGKKIRTSRLLENLQSRGYIVSTPGRDIEEAPDPFEGFKEHYAASDALTT
ncbi:hypothetical protein E2P81_ATG02981 [Venturia nashicola]|uniref:NACHT domain-containing protein n=1 Tax=Venturia nashicola TaxID=86259 RepID=A0A4Z1PJ51_9PEZI|nr:hypothetical protein E6O75_ATG03046 [Venturia nashicola]TLD36092.1 hypothetical protein E2P81_ATG02981 [Venturia nashicola]